ncbi:MAG TPA: AI-2E family transporter [Terriglobales bacterium]|nr:AI-2E family transporter [Terriglobales bacterium]
MGFKTHRSDILFTFGVLLFLWLCWVARDVLMLVYASVLFAVVLNPAIEAIRRIHIGHWWPDRITAILIIIAAVLVIFTLLVIFAIPPILRDLENFSAAFPQRMAGVSGHIRQLPLMQTFDPAVFEDRVAASLGSPLEIMKNVAGLLIALFSWAILTAYFILDGERTFYWFLSFFHEPRRGRVRSIALRAQRRIRHWLIGQGLLMLLLGVTSGLAFWFLHIKYALVLGFVAGVLNIVPFVGPITGFVLASAVAMFDAWPKFLGVCAYYFVYQQFEQAYLAPKIMTLSVDLPPLAVIVALSVGAALGGVLGAIVAVPTAAVIAVLVEEYLVRFRPHPAAIVPVRVTQQTPEEEEDESPAFPD